MAAKKKHVPQRTCIACRQVKSKRELVRVVRTPQRQVVVDPTGKAAGRGAYLCNTRQCWQTALQRGALARALKTEISEEDLAALKEYVAMLQS